ncbi:MAG: DNA polymerase I [Bacteroidetes bacterium]|nr:DNA polymerase I [Bacteroidota bacterium]HET6245446.1 DNA polymerase I [Bacteroidia bacterium]
MSQKKLFLLDAYALIYRAYFAFSKNPRYNSQGLNTSAILGFTNSLVEVLQKEKPSHIAVVFDTAGPTSRHEGFTEYKANREAQPEDITLSIPYIMRIIEGFNIPVLFSEGYEADDVIGTLAKKAEKEGFITYMMTPDKDFGQLVTDKIFIYKPASFGNEAKVMGVKEVCEKFEIDNPLQVIDILGLMGDAVDNIPGIPGVGEKTAKTLIAQFGSVENLLLNTDKLKGKLKEKVEANVDKAIMSKMLATILLDAPVELDEIGLRIEEPDRNSLKEIFAELEFRTIGKRILGEDIPAAVVKTNGSAQMDLFGGEQVPEPLTIDVVTEDVPAKEYDTLENTSHYYEIADSNEKILKLAQELKKSNGFCFDTETTGLSVTACELVGMSFSIKPFSAHYVPLPEDKHQLKDILDVFKSVFEDETIEKTGQNLKYDLSVLKTNGIDVKGKLFDTMLAHYLIEPDMKHNMDFLAETYLNYAPVSYQTLAGKKGKDQLALRAIPIEKVADYACEDADITLRLRNFFSPLLEKTGTKDLFEKIEVPLIPVLTAMETEGISIDVKALNEFSIELDLQIKALEIEVYECCGEEFNIASPKQLGEVLFNKLGIDDKAKKTKTGQFSTGEEVLTKLVNKHPIVEKILSFRSLQKLKSTYVDSLPLMVNSKTGKIHTNFNQTVAATGRLSSNNPNLQNIPIRTENGREVRKAFVPSEGKILLAADYSQIELRIIAELSGDENLSEAFIRGQDIHASTASKIYNIPLEDVSKEMRRNAKTVNFGIIYGISAFGLSERLGIPRREAANIIEQYFIQFPKIKQYMNNTINSAREFGYVETIMQRRRYLRDINSRNSVVRGFAERNAINAPIQGSAADMIKIAMINIHNDFNEKNLESKMILQVHDELLFDVIPQELEMVKVIVEERMRTAIKMNIPVVVDMGTGFNWLDAH